MRTIKIHNSETNKDDKIKLYSTPEVAERLGISYKSALKMINKNEIKALSLGNSYFVSENALRELIS